MTHHDLAPVLRASPDLARGLSVGTASVTRATELTVRQEIMTTLQNRPNTALLVVDVQSGVVDGNHERDTVVANVGALVDKARREQVPVVWVQHSSDMLEKGSEEWRIVPELAPGGTEPLVEKNLPGLVRGHDAGERAVRPGRRAAGGGRRADR